MLRSTKVHSSVKLARELILCLDMTEIALSFEIE